MDDIVFKNAKVLYRKEIFGGIAQYNSQLFILNKKQYDFLHGFRRYRYYSKLSFEEKQIIDEFLKNEIFLKINKNIEDILI